MGSIADQDHPLRLFLFDSPRTNCHVFYKLFSEHPQLGWGRSYHGFAGAALYGPERMQLRLRHGEQAEASQLEYANSIPPEIPATYEEATKRLLQTIADTEKEGKIFFGKEHILALLQQDTITDTIRRDDPTASIQVTTNPLHIPDAIMDTLTPLFVIRHPILIVNSLYRGLAPVYPMLPTDEDFTVWTTLRWTRMLYDYFSRRGQNPVVVEAQDLIYNTIPTAEAVCKAVGLKHGHTTEKWDPVPEKLWPDHKMGRAFTGDFMASSGVERRTKEPAESTIDLDTETKKWTEKYGEEIAQGLRKRVEAEMPIYEYLRGLKLRP